MFAFDAGHEAEDFFLGGVFAGEFADEAAFAHHEDACGEVEDFGEFGADEHDRDAPGGELVEEVVDGSLGADIIAIAPGYAMEQLVYFLIVVAVGGLGTIRGPFVAALLLGLGDTACKMLVPQFGAFFVYAAVLVVLLLKPAGLFGKA